MSEALPYEKLAEKDNLNVLIVDGGMRGQALQWALQQGARAGHIDTEPFGNSLNPEGEARRIIEWSKAYDLVLIGQERALAAGIVGRLLNIGIPACGPTEAQARPETDKAHAKQMFMDLGLPTAPYATFWHDQLDAADAYIDELGDVGVIKDAYLADGKGVGVFTTNKEGHELLRRMRRGDFSNKGELLVIEAFSEGPEWSGHASISGQTYDIWPAAEDHKQVGRGDTGLMGGGSGVVSPLEWLDPATAYHKVEQTISGLLTVVPNVHGFAFPGFKGEDVLEVNMRTGSTETETHVRNMDSDFLEHVVAIMNGTLDQHRLRWKDGYAVSIVGMAPGYPDKDAIVTGELITGLEAAREVEDVVIFLGSVAVQDGELFSTGGRLFAVTARGNTVAKALERALIAMNKLRVGGQVPNHRDDIGKRTHAFPTP